LGVAARELFERSSVVLHYLSGVIAGLVPAIHALLG
jgi:hypothetical protein